MTERLRRPSGCAGSPAASTGAASPEEIVADDPSWAVLDAWPYGDSYVLEQLWQRFGVPALTAELTGSRKLEFAVERALFAMVANRACAPASKLYCHQQWLAEDVRIAGCESLQLQHLYRAMDFLEAHNERGLRQPTLATLFKLASGLETSPYRWSLSSTVRSALGWWTNAAHDTALRPPGRCR